MKDFSLYFSSIVFTGVKLKKIINYYYIANVLLSMIIWVFNQRFPTPLMISDISDSNLISDYITVSKVPVNRLFAIRTKFYEKKCVQIDVIIQVQKQSLK